jgi:toxin ParE1/3/4
MSYKVIFTKRAKDDLRGILDYYDGQSAETAKSFLLALAADLDLLSEHPKAGPLAFAKVRKKTMLKFPFNLFYTIKPQKKEIIIARIWHHRRDPKSLSTK